ncbi:uncharacterized protein LOC102804363 [Saccoglossus kowalevskii]|uniref:Uncharacterized protein LOC102804363 n=1 Tax=Saccoglossus kowalevskii TaxID=10224 RepID=A0ABM0MZU7_SACKO|nr:PREDICTED: uncharacterized protein LOC102804363 [Saccoglossus kowalevskii]
MKRTKIPQNKGISPGEQRSETSQQPISHRDRARTRGKQNTTNKTSFFSRCLSIGKYIVLLMVLPAFLNHALLYKEGDVLKPPGQIYEIDEQKMYLHCVGRGSPTVVLDAPTGMSSDVWIFVQEKLSKLTKVCIYDRAGLGYSEAPSQFQYKNVETDEKEKSYMHNKWQEATTERMADDLKKLLSVSKTELPYILVGSEIGALIARFYAQLSEISDVTDIVLIDPITEILFKIDDGIWTQFWFGHLVPSFQALHTSAIVGLSRIALLMGLMQQPIIGPEFTLPDDVVARQKYLLCNPSHLKTVVDEHYFINESISQINTLWQMKSFPSNISVTVVTGNYYDEQLPSNLNTAWAKSHQHLISTLHPGCKHIVINGADHHMLYRNPDAVTDPIKRLVRQWRQRRAKTVKQ